jgi:hypothetical protein
LEGAYSLAFGSDEEKQFNNRKKEISVSPKI